MQLRADKQRPGNEIFYCGWLWKVISVNPCANRPGFTQIILDRPINSVLPIAPSSVDTEYEVANDFEFTTWDRP